jgi:hypothetical protein
MRQAGTAPPSRTKTSWATNHALIVNLTTDHPEMNAAELLGSDKSGSGPPSGKCGDKTHRDK